MPHQVHNSERVKMDLLVTELVFHHEGRDCTSELTSLQTWYVP